MQLLINPSQKPYGTVCQSIVESLRFCSLLGIVPATFVHKPSRARQAFLFAFRIRREKMLHGENGVGGKRGRFATGHIDVRSHAGRWIKFPHGASDVGAPITALGDVFLVSELLHQLVEDLRILVEAEAFSLGTF